MYGYRSLRPISCCWKTNFQLFDRLHLTLVIPRNYSMNHEIGKEKILNKIIKFCYEKYSRYKYINYPTLVLNVSAIVEMEDVLLIHSCGMDLILFLHLVY